MAFFESIVEQAALTWFEELGYRQVPVTCPNNLVHLSHTVGKNQVGLKFTRQGFVIESPEWDHSEVEELGV